MVGMVRIDVLLHLDLFIATAIESYPVSVEIKPEWVEWKFIAEWALAHYAELRSDELDEISLDDIKEYASDIALKISEAYQSGRYRGVLLKPEEIRGCLYG